jgi:hypothetical protein
VLLSFRKRLTIALCPSHIAVAESARGWRAQSTRPTAFTGEFAEGASGWQVPLATLALWLEKNKPSATDVEIILSDSVARYALVPWSDDVQKASEIEMFSRIHFESLFGANAAQWDIQVDFAEYGKPGIGCAVDRALITALQELLAKFGLRPALLQPYFMHVFNRWRDRINSNALFAVVDTGVCVIATMKDAAWNSIRTVRANDHMASELTTLIGRELLLQGLDAQSTVYLHQLNQLNPGDMSALKRSHAVVQLDVPESSLNATAKQAAGQTMLLCRSR